MPGPSSICKSLFGDSDKTEKILNFLQFRNILNIWYHFSNILISCVVAKKMLNFLLKPFVMFPRYEEIILSYFVSVSQDNLNALGWYLTKMFIDLVISTPIFCEEGCDFEPLAGRRSSFWKLCMLLSPEKNLQS